MLYIFNKHNMSEDLKIKKFLEEIEVLIQKCDDEFGSVDGSFKLKKKLESEKRFLISVMQKLFLFSHLLKN